MRLATTDRSDKHELVLCEYYVSDVDVQSLIMNTRVIRKTVLSEFVNKIQLILS